MTFRQALLKNPQLTLLVCFACCATLTILPFGFWRLWQGQVLVGLIEIALVGSFLSAVWFGWRHQRLDPVSYVAAAFISVGVIVLAPMIGRTALFWCYPILVANLLLISRQHGFLANLAVVAGLMSFGDLFQDGIERTGFVFTALSVTMYAYWFAIMADTQRDRLEALATFDELTGAGNRRLMEADLEELLARQRHLGLPHAIAVLDLDHFKSVNDRYGHHAGDKVLIRLVQLVQRTLRRQDRLYRLGGEEFVLLFPHAGRAGLEAALERLQAYLGPRLKSPGGPVTASIGGAVLEERDNHWSDWLARADAALYESKDAGRARIRVSGERPLAPAEGAPDLLNAMPPEDTITLQQAR